MYFYVASKLANEREVKLLINKLAALDHVCTYDWTRHGSVKGDRPRMGEVSTAEINAVRDADVVVVLLPGGRGTHVELGAALALEREVYLVGPEDDTCAFYFHPGVKRVPDVATLLRILP